MKNLAVFPPEHHFPKHEDISPPPPPPPGPVVEKKNVVTNLAFIYLAVKSFS
jgi:hypothetical protein